MNRFFLIPLFITLLNAQTPKPFAKLGDPIYTNLHKIILLKKMKIDTGYNQNIKKYIKDVKKLKKMGFALENHSDKVNPKTYITALRRVSEINKIYLTNIQNIYIKSMQNNDFITYAKFLNSGLIDIQAHKKEIYDYYNKHSEQIQLDEKLNDIVKIEKKHREKKAQLKKHAKKITKREEKILRLRAHDVKVKKALEKKLERELQERKRKIVAQQCMELHN